MATRTYEVFYLGNFQTLDPTEGTNNTISENAGLLVGRTFGGPGKPNQLWNRIVNLTINDVNNDGTVREDPPAQAEPISYNIGSGVQTSPLDSSQSYTATITYGPNTGLPPVTVTVVIAQDNAGNMFLVPPIAQDATFAALRAAPIQSITINSLVTANSQGLTLVRTSPDLLCFGRGARILTERGEVPVEELREGDMVATEDHGPQPLRAVLSRIVAAEGAFAPVVFAPGAIGNRRELVLSPQHRVLVAGAALELLFGAQEVLVPALAMVDGRSVTRREGGEVEYFHLVFDRHEIIFADGTRTESLHVGPGALDSLSPAGRLELLRLFPDCAELPLARLGLRPYEGRLAASVMREAAAPVAMAAAS